MSLKSLGQHIQNLEDLKSLLLQKEKRIRELEKLLLSRECKICDFPMCPHRDHNYCKKCERYVCYFCTLEDYSRELEMCSECAEKSICEICNKDGDISECLECASKCCDKCLRKNVCGGCLDFKTSETCEICGKTNVDITPCQICGEYSCDDCKGKYAGEIQCLVCLLYSEKNWCDECGFPHEGKCFKKNF